MPCPEQANGRASAPSEGPAGSLAWSSTRSAAALDTASVLTESREDVSSTSSGSVFKELPPDACRRVLRIRAGDGVCPVGCGCCAFVRRSERSIPPKRLFLVSSREAPGRQDQQRDQ